MWRACMALTICSDSEGFTRTSLAPWAISSGRAILLTRLSGERSCQELAAVFGGVVAHPHLPQRLPGLPVVRDRRQEGEQIGDAEHVDGAGEFLGREGRADQRRVAAVARAVDGDPLLVGDAALDGPVDRLDQVVVHLAAPFEIGCVNKGFA